MAKSVFRKTRRSWWRYLLYLVILLVLAGLAARFVLPHTGFHGWGHHDRGGDGYSWDGGGKDRDGKGREGKRGKWRGVPGCPREQRWIETRIFMGRDIDGDRLGVSEADWRDFLDSEIRTRLPDGFSVADVYGYSAADNPNHQKWTKVLILLHDGSEGKRAALDGIADAYLARFEKNAILRTDAFSCVEFRFNAPAG